MVLALDLTAQRPLPFVKWAGGKTSLVSELLRHVPSHFSNYYEPFLGGGAFFFTLFSIRRSFNGFLSDLNAELIDAYKIVRDNVGELIPILSELQDEYYKSENKGAYYYEKRSWRPPSLVESAARLIFLNKTCYNGLYRVNSRGEFNVPFGRYKNPKILDEKNLRAVSKALRETKAKIRCSDYTSAISKCGEDDLVYLDPPYQPKSKTSSFTDYTAGGFSEKDQEVLAQEFRKLVEKRCAVILSNSETPMTVRLYREFGPKTVMVNRPINSVASGRTGYRELVVAANSEKLLV